MALVWYNLADSFRTMQIMKMHGSMILDFEVPCRRLSWPLILTPV